MDPTLKGLHRVHMTLRLLTNILNWLELATLNLDWLSVTFSYGTKSHITVKSTTCHVGKKDHEFTLSFRQVEVEKIKIGFGSFSNN